MPCLPFFVWISHILDHDCGCSVRELAARLLGIITMAMSRDATVSLLHGLLLSMGERDGKAARFEDAEGALSAVGYVLAQCLTGTSCSLPCRKQGRLALPLFDTSHHPLMIPNSQACHVKHLNKQNAFFVLAHTALTVNHQSSMPSHLLSS